ncbi:Hsp20/alpha crystallin family protein [Streptomyces roseochromogenus]|uniref:Hsp20/alpha crystallin family protein n=1 Tax=Streptomyces roseochromogenus TaxID=285450 RepID=UPI001FD7C213|nr:Hsp20/alpha crystallin family protein [Streptomyces roseochromogenus]
MREDINVEVSGRELHITGEPKEREGVLRRTGRFEYRALLPTEVKAEDVHATLADGILTVAVPRLRRPSPITSRSRAEPPLPQGHDRRVRTADPRSTPARPRGVTSRIGCRTLPAPCDRNTPTMIRRAGTCVRPTGRISG